jgi:hypothetical protein
MGIRISKKLKYNLPRFIVIGIVFLIFVFIRVRGILYQDILSQFGACFNEMQYLGLYMLIFLISLAPILYDIFKEQIVIRQTDKWGYTLCIFVEIVKSAAVYAFAISFGWFIIIGTGVGSWNTQENWRYIGIIFLGQFVGWTMAGMLETMLYFMTKSLPLAFVLCYFIFIATNLSLYVNTSQQLEYYIRIYEMMFHIELFNSIYTLISVICFYLAIISILIWLCYWFIKHHDFLGGGGRIGATKESHEK